MLLGKTNMVEFAYGSNATVSFFGPVHNPWSLDHNPGGSSSGSAAATAAGLCYGALGSDTAGSIRQPASLCGVVGLMPTYGSVSTAGVIPLSWSNDHVGPLTRTVEDNALMLQVLAGYDAADTNSIRASVPDYRSLLRRSTSSIRVGVPRDFLFDDLDQEVDISTKRALAVIQMITAGLRDVTLPYRASDLESARGVVRAAEAYVYHTEWVTKTPAVSARDIAPATNGHRCRCGGLYQRTKRNGRGAARYRACIPHGRRAGDAHGADAAALAC